MNILKTVLAIGLAFFLFSAAPASAQVLSRNVAASTAAEGSKVGCVVGCIATNLQVNSGGTAVWVMVFDATTVPADGASQTPIKLWQMAINTTLNHAWVNGLRLINGFVVVCSSTGPFTKTVSNTCTFSVDAQ